MTTQTSALEVLLPDGCSVLVPVKQNSGDSTNFALSTDQISNSSQGNFHDYAFAKITAMLTRISAFSGGCKTLKHGFKARSQQSNRSGHSAQVSRRFERVDSPQRKLWVSADVAQPQCFDLTPATDFAAKAAATDEEQETP